jgi:hypothetical protein
VSGQWPCVRRVGGAYLVVDAWVANEGWLRMCMHTSGVLGALGRLDGPEVRWHIYTMPCSYGRYVGTDLAGSVGMGDIIERSTLPGTHGTPSYGGVLLVPVGYLHRHVCAYSHCILI